MTAESVNLWLGQPWVQAAIGVSGILVGCVITALVYQLQKEKSKICLHHKLFRLLGYPDQALPQEIEFRFRGEQLKRLEKILVLFWNGGNVTISETDAIATDPFRLEGDFRIVDAKILKTTRDVTNVRLRTENFDKGIVGFEFDFLDPQDGAVAEILCEGFTERKGKIHPPSYQILGTFRRMPRGFNDRKANLPMVRSSLLGFSAGAIGCGALAINGIYQLVTGDFKLGILIALILFIPLTGIMLLLVILGLRRYPAKLRMPELLSR